MNGKVNSKITSWAAGLYRTVSLHVLAPAVILSWLLSGCAEHAPQTGMVLPTPQGLTLTLQEDTTALLEWQPVASASHYYVVLQESESGSKAAELAEVTVTSVVFEGLEGGMSYYCRVRAINGMEYSDFARSGIITVPEKEPEEPGTGDTENPDDGGDTGNPDSGDDTENPGTGDTENPDDGGDTENPDTGEDTEDPGTDTENPDDGGDTGNPDTGEDTES